MLEKITRNLLSISLVAMQSKEFGSSNHATAKFESAACHGIGNLQRINVELNCEIQKSKCSKIQVSFCYQSTKPGLCLENCKNQESWSKN